MKSHKGNPEAADSAWSSGIVSLLSHDVRNLAAGMTGIFELIGSGQLSMDNAEFDEFIRMGYQSGTELLESLGQIVDLYRLATRERGLNEDRFQLNDVVSYAVDRVEDALEAKNVSLALEVTSTGGYGDRGLLQRALAVLLARVIDATEPGQMVRVRARREIGTCGSHIKVELTSTPPDLQDVRNQGCPLLDILDAPFPKGNEPLGRPPTLGDLEIVFCQRVITLHGGRLLVSGGPAGDVTASFTIPMPEDIGNSL